LCREHFLADPVAREHRLRASHVARGLPFASIPPEFQDEYRLYTRKGYSAAESAAIIMETINAEKTAGQRPG
jgi:hypothetical protein